MRYEAYNVAHDQFEPGLRDYRARPEGEDPVSLQWLLLVTLIALAFVTGFAAGRNL